MAKWLITRFQTLWPRRVTMLWHLCPSTLSRPHQIQWVWVNFCCSSNSLLLGADVLKYELCVYSPVLFEAPCCNPSSKCHTGMSTTFKYSNPAGCQLHLWLRWSDPQNSMENRADLWVTVWKIYTEYVKNEKWPTKVLFDGHPGGSSTKTILICDRRNHLALTLLIWKRQPRYTAKKRISSPSKWTNIGAFFVGWWNDDTYWEWLEACWRVFNWDSPLQLRD